MDQNYIDIEARIRHAQKLRSQAMAELITSGLDQCRRFLARFQHSGATRTISGAPSSALVALHDRP